MTRDYISLGTISKMYIEVIYIFRFISNFISKYNNDSCASLQS